LTEAEKAGLMLAEKILMRDKPKVEPEPEVKSEPIQDKFTGMNRLQILKYLRDTYGSAYDIRMNLTDVLAMARNLEATASDNAQ